MTDCDCESCELAAELAAERTLHQETIRERDALREQFHAANAGWSRTIQLAEQDKARSTPGEAA